MAYFGFDVKVALIASAIVMIARAAGGRTHIFRILVKTGLDELLECLGIVAGELRRVVFWNEEENPHGVQLRVGWFPFGQLDGRDAQAPDVGLPADKKQNN